MEDPGELGYWWGYTELGTKYLHATVSQSLHVSERIHSDIERRSWYPSSRHAARMNTVYRERRLRKHDGAIPRMAIKLNGVVAY